MIDRPTPGQPAPDLNVDLVGGGSWKLADQSPDAFSMLVFYRGLHCPVCRSYNRKLDRMAGDFADLGVCLLYTSPSPRDGLLSRMPSSA